ncbi:bacteriophage terminase endonuclease subunit [Betaproteobacteria bacterium]|nr:bacteriophage terminase endonuclease subunit [Betaproteobacteria bacterium]
MITPAQRHREFVAAKKAGTARSAPEPSRQRNAYELMLARLDEDKRRLHLIQSVERKIAVKREILPVYAAWVDGVLAADSGGQDDVVVTVMIWRIDTGDYAGALTLAAHALRHGLVLPDKFKRTLGTLVAEEIADAALRRFAAGDPAFPLDILTRVLELTLDADMPDEVRARLIRAEGLAQEAAGHPQRALASFQHALSLHDKVGVKKDIERVQRALKNLANEQTAK